jgi:hypothetical protein
MRDAEKDHGRETVVKTELTIIHYILMLVKISFTHLSTRVDRLTARPEHKHDHVAGIREGAGAQVETVRVVVV